MSERVFEMRLVGGFSGDENNISGLNVELFEDQCWKTLDLNLETPGFLVFVYSVFTCQYMHLRLGSAECNLLLKSATGSIHLTTDEDWHLTQIRIDFECRLRSGNPTVDKTNSITQRMKSCPVSKNLKPGVDCETSISFEQA